MLNILSYIDQNYQTHFRELKIENHETFETDGNDKTSDPTQSYLNTRTASVPSRTISVNSGGEKEFSYEKEEPLI